MKVIFLPGGIEYRFDGRKTLLELATEAGVSAIDGSCGGDGSCGKCKVQVLAGNTDEWESEERARLTEQERRAGVRLACRFQPERDTTVWAPSTRVGMKQQAAAIPIRSPFDFTSENEMAVPPADAEGAPIGAEAVRAACYGVAFDIGTTTVVGYLWNFQTATLVGAAAATNPQGVHGADVIRRLAFAGERAENRECLRQEVVRCLNQLVGELARSATILPEHICNIVVVGNTAMSHLFLGADSRPLAVSPFTPAFTGSVVRRATELGLAVNDQTICRLLPNIAGHVGSDITAGLIAVGILPQGCPERDTISLLLDIGTNGELVLAGKKQALACSTAAGPAFEGATIYQGMRATEGAIEQVAVGDDVTVTIVGGEKARGICGSGIIDAVAGMLRAGLIAGSGRLMGQEQARKESIAPALTNRLREGKTGREFVLVGEGAFGDIVVCQKDIREVQLAKAAIRAGIRILAKRMGIEEAQIDRIYIAGAFGSGINIDSALAIGLLPDIGRENISLVGNAAGAGACLALLSQETQEEAETIARAVAHVELASCDEFAEEYLRAMGFA